MTECRMWTAEEDEKLLTLVEQEVRRYQLPAHFPYRTAASVKSRFDILMRRRVVRNAEKRSRDLANAINALIERMPANDVADMLGKPHLKLFEVAPYKTSSAIRELAA